MYRVAIGKTINKLTNDLYEVDGKSYYIKISGENTAIIEKSGDATMLLIPLKDKVQYSVLW
jgi:hypothetical protein